MIIVNNKNYIMTYWLHVFVFVWWTCHAYAFAVAPIKTYNFQVDNQTTLRAVRTINPNKVNNHHKKVILYLPGRASFYEQNTRFIDVLTGSTPYLDRDNKVTNPLYNDKSQYDVWTIDYRGHGSSGGRLNEGCRQRCHINNFDIYLSDIHKIVHQLITHHYDHKPIQLIIIGDSLGGHLALRYAQTYPNDVQHILLIAPMLQFKTGRWPTWLARFIVSTVCFIARAQDYAMGYGPYNMLGDDFSTFTGHHNEQEFHNTLKIMQQHQNYVTGGPTYGWVKAGFDSCDYSLEKQQLLKIKSAVTIYLSGGDTVVDNRAVDQVRLYLPSSTILNYPGAYHGLIKEHRLYNLDFYQHLTTTLTAAF